MDEVRDWTDVLYESYSELLDTVVSAFPKVIGGILLLFIGWLLARLMAFLVSRSLKLLRFDKLMERVQMQDFLDRVNAGMSPSQMVGKFVFWILILLMVVGLAEAMQLSMVSQQISGIIAYLPNVIIASLILLIGLSLASRLRDFLTTALSSYAIRSAKLIGNMIFYLLAIFVVLTTLEQLQFNIDLLTSNVMIVLAGICLAFALGYGLAAREIFPNIISSYYSKNMFKVGDTIRTAETEGTILEITNMSVVIQTADGKRFIPAKKLIVEEIDVLEEK
ncbi:MAG: mechanosensitive ion channel domain-containing protein [Bacteroidota bacterium]